MDRTSRTFGFEMPLYDVTAFGAASEFKVFRGGGNQGRDCEGPDCEGRCDLSPRSRIDALGETAKSFGAKGLAWLKITPEGQLESVIAKFLDAKALHQPLPEAKPGDLVLFGADKAGRRPRRAGPDQAAAGRRAEADRHVGLEALWVIEFPLLDYSPEEKRYIFMHNPFAAPMDEDVAVPGFGAAQSTGEGL